METNEERKERCGTCRFWASGSAECRRRAPIVLSSTRAGAWPVTTTEEWCGEWASAAEQLVAASPEDCIATRRFLARLAPMLEIPNPAALMESLLPQLPSDVRRVLVRTNGLDGRPPVGLKDVAREFKMSQGHVRALITMGEELLTEAVRLLAPRHEQQ